MSNASFELSFSFFFLSGREEDAQDPSFRSWLSSFLRPQKTPYLPKPILSDNDLSVSYITLQGFVGCVFGGIDGSLTYLKSYGIPQTVPVGPPQVQVNGTCKDPNIDLSVS